MRPCNLRQDDKRILVWVLFLMQVSYARTLVLRFTIVKPHWLQGSLTNLTLMRNSAFTGDISIVELLRGRKSSYESCRSMQASSNSHVHSLVYIYSQTNISTQNRHMRNELFIEVIWCTFSISERIILRNNQTDRQKVNYLHWHLSWPGLVSFQGMDICNSEPFFHSRCPRLALVLGSTWPELMKTVQTQP